MIRLIYLISLVTLVGAVAVSLATLNQKFFLLVTLVAFPLFLFLILRRWPRRQPVGWLLAGAWFFLLASTTAIALPELVMISQTEPSVVQSTDNEVPFSTEILTFMDIVPQKEVPSLPARTVVSQCYGEWCEVAGWEFKSNPRPSKTGVSQLMDVVDARVIWPDGRETILEKDVNLGAIAPAPPALLTDRFVRYGTYQGDLPVGDYRFQFTFADGTVTELAASYQGEVTHIPHDMALEWDGVTLSLNWQQDQPTGTLERYDVLVYPKEQRFPGQIQSFNVLRQVIDSGLEHGNVQVTLHNIQLKPNTTYVVELSAKAGAAHTGTGQRLTITTEGQ